MKKFITFGALVLGLLISPTFANGGTLFLGNVGSNLSSTLPIAGGSSYYKCTNSVSFSCQSDALKISYSSRTGGNGTSGSPYILTGCSFVSCACSHTSYLVGGKTCVLCPDNSMAGLVGSYHTETSCSYCSPSSLRTASGCVSCPAHATCNGTTTLTCDKGYYKSGDAACTRCPQVGPDARETGTTKSSGATAKTECYIPSGTQFNDYVGAGNYGGDSYWCN